MHLDNLQRPCREASRIQKETSFQTLLSRFATKQRQLSVQLRAIRTEIIQSLRCLSGLIPSKYKRKGSSGIWHSTLRSKSDGQSSETFNCRSATFPKTLPLLLTPRS